LIIAVDAAGGDYAPSEIVKGAIEAAGQPGIEIVLVGQKSTLKMLLRHHEKKPNIQIVNARQVIHCNESPVQAVRNKTDSSIVVGTKLVKNGDASAFVSAGSTGAVLTAAYLHLKKLEGIERPALCGLISINAAFPFLLIDAGANVDCRPSFLVQFARMGDIFARRVIGIEIPKISLLNNGAEEMKGTSLTQESYQLLMKAKLNFTGNVEGHEVLTGKADVIVTDGFTGNIMLKTMEGFGEFFQNLLPVEQTTQVTQLLQGQSLVHYSDLILKAKRMDYKEYGGACLLGVNGNIIVSHGRSQAGAIKNAISLAYKTAALGITDCMRLDPVTL
jgi:phosphate acyltransferase